MRQSIWQLIALIVTLCAAIGGGLAYQTSMIDKRIEQIETRFEQIDNRFDQSDMNASDHFQMLEKRIEQSETNMAARFEDLKQVRAQRK